MTDSTRSSGAGWYTSLPGARGGFSAARTQLGSSGTGFFGCSCLPKAVTGVSQPGVGLESAYSGPRVELRPPVYPSPVIRADLVLVGAVHLGGGGSLRRHGYRVGDCSAEGGTRLGCVSLTTQILQGLLRQQPLQAALAAALHGVQGSGCARGCGRTGGRDGSGSGGEYRVYSGLVST